MSRAKRFWVEGFERGVLDWLSASAGLGVTAASCSSDALRSGSLFLAAVRVLAPETRPRRREADDEVRELVPILGLASGMEVSRRRASRCLASVLLFAVDDPGTDFSFVLSFLWEGLVLGTLRIEAEVLCLVRPTGRGTRQGLEELVGVGVLFNLAMFSPLCAGGVLLTLPRGDTDFEEGILSLGIPVSCLCRRVFAVVAS